MRDTAAAIALIVAVFMFGQVTAALSLLWAVRRVIRETVRELEERYPPGGDA